MSPSPVAELIDLNRIAWFERAVFQAAKVRNVFSVGTHSANSHFSGSVYISAPRADTGGRKSKKVPILPANEVSVKRVLYSFFLLMWAATRAVSGPLLFEGTFSSDNQVALFDVTTNTAASVRFITYSYAGGNVNATSIPGGGFSPTAFLFDHLGNVFVLSNDGTCTYVGQDSGTGNCNDLYYQNTLGPGSFTLALAVYDNNPLGTEPGDGFSQDLNPGFTCQEAGVAGNFCDLSALGMTRTGNFAISIEGADDAAPVGAPEPGTLLFFCLGGATLLLLRRA